MGLFDFFKRTDNRTDKLGKKPPQVRREVARWADKAADKRAQNYDRQEAIAALCDLCQPLEDAADLAQTEKGQARLEEHELTRVDAAAALLKRFNWVMDPSITDSEEKSLVFEGLLGLGKKIVEPLRPYTAKAESLGWPIKLIKANLDEEEIVAELLRWLSKWDTEYAKFVEPKVQLLAELEQHKDPSILEAVKDFRWDVNEPSRFHAVGAMLAQDDDAAIGPLSEMFVDEESLRIRNRICEAFLTRGWIVPEDQRAEMRKSLPSEYNIDGEGHIRKR